MCGITLIKGNTMMKLDIRKLEIQHLKRQVKKYKYDALTNLQGRLDFEELLEIRFNSDQPFCLVLADVNGLKATNTAKGYAAGDQLIRSAAKHLIKCINIPTEDSIFRIGTGDEFTALIDTTTAIDSNNLGCISDEFTIATVFSKDYSSTQKLFNAADDLLRQRKLAYYLSTGKERRKR